MYIQGTTCVYRGYHMYICRVPHVYIQDIACLYTGHRMVIYKVTHAYIQCTICVYTRLSHACIHGPTCVYKR